MSPIDPIDKAAEEARKAKADADTAEAAARKAKREEDEASSPAAVARRDVIAGKDAAAAQREQVAALVPDLSKLSGDLALASGGEPTGGTAVAGRALVAAAEAVKEEVIDTVEADDWSLLVTSDAELAASDAAYHSIVAGLDRLSAWAVSVLGATADLLPGGRRDLAPAAPAGAIAAAVAQAVPGLLSLLSADRTLTTGTVKFDDIAAAAAVAGALKGRNPKRKVFHDSMRPLPSGGTLATKVEELSEKREELIERRVALEAREPDGDATAAKLTEAIKLVSAASEAIGEIQGKLTAVPEGAAAKSPLAAAILREGLHDGSIRYVLLVKAEAASGMQLVNDRPLWLKDRFSVIAAASITWMLVEAATGGLLDGAVTTGTAQVNGKIGGRLEIQA